MDLRILLTLPLGGIDLPALVLKRNILTLRSHILTPEPLHPVLIDDGCVLVLLPAGILEAILWEVSRMTSNRNIQHLSDDAGDAVIASHLSKYSCLGTDQHKRQS